MSATIEAEEFAYYFRCQNFNTSLPAPIIYVNKKSTYTKTTFYMEQLTVARNSTTTEVRYLVYSYIKPPHLFMKVNQNV